MKTRDWTDDQKRAFRPVDGNFLVGAGAGSGKTAVLTERVKQFVLSGKATVDQLLVLTFTNKAAHEMKERIRDAFIEEGRTDLAEEVETSAIMTFDAFALDLVKKYHYAIGLDDDIEIMDEGLLMVEKRKLLDHLLEERYQSGADPVFNDMVFHYAIKDDDRIVDLVLSLTDLADLSVDPEDFYAHYLDKFYSSSFVEDSLCEFLSLQKEAFRTLEAGLDQYSEACPALKAKEEALLRSCESFPTYEAMYEFFLLQGKQGYPQPLRGRAKEELTAEDKALHKTFGKIYGAIKKAVLAYGNEANVKDRYQSTRPYAALFIKLAHELSQDLGAFKKAHGVYSFADIAKFARDIAADPAVGPLLRDRCRYIMVDEYQDTSNLQERFLAALDMGNTFEVGDVKQSIYRFRNAAPENFMRKFEQYGVPGNPFGTLITMKDNFRSRQEVLSDINNLFSKIMSRELGSVNYDGSQELAFGNTKDYGLEDQAGRHMEFLTFKKDEVNTRAEAEAKIIANDILKKMRSAYPVMVKELDESGHSKTVLGHVSWSSFAILIARKTEFPVYQKVFAAAKIPLEATSELSIADEDVSLVFLSLARLLASDDEKVIKHAYVSVSRSYLYGLKDPAIYEAVKNGSYLTSDLLDKINKEKPLLGKIRVSEAVDWLFKNFPLIDNLPFLGDVKANYEKLATFRSVASQMDHLGASFADFVEHFSDLDKYDVDFTKNATDEGTNAVRLMSIHASKGLEFPLVYIPDIANKVQLSDLGAFSFSEKRGLVLPLLDGGEAYNIFHELVKNDESQAAISERMRLFYVALTRACEKLIIVERENEGASLARLDALNLLRIRAKKDKNGEDDTTVSLSHPQSFSDFFVLSGLRFNKKEVTPTEPVPLEGEQPALETRPLQFEALTDTAVLKESVRPSKDSLEPANEGALLYGVRLHRDMELVDFHKLDASFISEVGERKTIEKVLSLPLFQHLEGAECLSEYAYYDETNDVHGTIDLLILYPDKALIIDYKAKSIDDPAYEKQVGAYADYIARVTGLPVTKYLLSLGEARLRALQ